VGFHTYIGSNTRSVDKHAASLENFLYFLKQTPASLLDRLEYVNTGGGFGYDYIGRCPFDWESYGERVNEMAFRLREATGRNLVVKLEVGRAVVADCGYLVTRILHAFRKRHRPFLVIDSNLSHFGRPARYGFHRKFYPFMEDGFHQMALMPNGTGPKPEPKIEVCVVGNSHYSKDWFGLIEVPHFEPEQLVGSFLVIYDVGSYSEAMADHWADIPGPASVLLGPGNMETVVRRREQIDDLL
jgi:diaminopimelate decarboxylase